MAFYLEDAIDSSVGEPSSPKKTFKVEGAIDAPPTKQSAPGRVGIPRTSGAYALGKLGIPDQGVPDKTVSQALDEHPILAKGAEGAGFGAMMGPAGRALMVGAPFTGPAAPLVEGLGAALSAAPLAMTGYGALSGAAGQTVREYGKSTLGKATEPVALATELLSPMGAQKGARALYEGAVGGITEMAEKLAPQARKLGFKLEPKPLSGASDPTLETVKHNQQLANKLVTGKAGSASNAITYGAKDSWHSKTYRDLGKQYEKIYDKKNIFTLDPASVQALKEKLNFELSLGTAASVPAVKSVLKELLPEKAQTGIEMLEGYFATKPEELAKYTNQYLDEFTKNGVQVTGDKLHRLKQELGKVAARHSDSADRRAAHEISDIINSSVRSTNPKISAELSELNPKFRTWATIDEMIQAGEVSGGNISLKKLGERLRSGPTRSARTNAGSHPLGELGLYGENLNLDSLGNIGATDKAAKGVDKVVKLAKKTLNPANIGAAGGYAMGGVPGALAGGAIGAGANSVLKGPLAQWLQMSLAEQMRNPAVSTLPAALSGGLSSFPF